MLWYLFDYIAFFSRGLPVSVFYFLDSRSVKIERPCTNISNKQINHHFRVAMVDH